VSVSKKKRKYREMSVGERGKMNEGGKCYISGKSN
jgi:hypothetical protein